LKGHYTEKGTMILNYYLFRRT